MDSNEIANNLELDSYGKLEVCLKKRNKVMCHKEVILPCVFNEDMDLSDVLDDIPEVRPHKHLKDNVNKINAVKDDIRKLKHSSELELEIPLDDGKELVNEINQNILRLRQKTETLFKKMINSQVIFNECLSIKGDMENKDYEQKFSDLIEETCKHDRGIKSVLLCKNDTLEKNIEKNLEVEDEEQLKKATDQLEQRLLSKLLDSGKKSFKTHEHYLAMKKYNDGDQSTSEIQEVLENTVRGTIDPFTRQEITKPVLNNVCKHVYDQEAINEMFKDKHFVACSYIGCTNKHFTKKDLKFNYITNNGN